jgi:hypothetical protein
MNIRANLIVALLALAACGAPAPDVTRRPAGAVETLPPMRLFGATEVQAPQRTNAEMAQDFMELAFRLESGREVPIFSRFEGPVTVRVTGPAPRTVPNDLGQLLTRLRSEAGIDISQTTRDQASITIEFLPRRRMQALVPKAACFVAPRVTSWDEFRRDRRTDIVDWTTLTIRQSAAVFIPSDTTPQEIRDCLHEEMAQALGPLNDLYRLPDSVFNDDNFHTVLTGFDMLMLRVHYAPDLASGMSRNEVAARLPAILARLNPRGNRPGTLPDDTPRAYVDAIETSLGPGAAAGGRRAAAKQAVAIAEDRGWRDVRAGFAWFALGRLSLNSRGDEALDALLRAGAIYHNLGDIGALQAAHVDMQLAAYALSQGQASETIDLVNRALGPVTRAQNAALMASLMMVKAEALDLVGRASEARQVRLDSLGWARYGFGSDTEVISRLADISALSPARRSASR